MMTEHKGMVCRTYTYPEQLAWMRDETGREILSRVPNHPTREARETDVNVWWEPAGEVR